MKSHPPSQRIDEEASLWAARLDGGMSDRDRAVFSAWLNARAEHRKAFENYRDLSARIDTHIDARLGAATEAVAGELKTSRKRRRAIVTVLATAAAIAVLFVATTRQSHDFATSTAERHAMALDDGSKIELNAQTTLSVDFKRDERRVRLVGGEALFAVAKDTARPFVIQTPAGTVRVTGTVFNVRAPNTERVEVTVIEGIVSVRPAGGPALEQSVTSGLQAVLGRETVAVRVLPEGTAQDAIAWRQGQVVFNDTPLSEVIEHFAAYHARVIVVSPQAADLRLGGRYSLEDLNGLLESIESVLPVHVLHQSGGNVQITATEPLIRQ